MTNVERPRRIAGLSEIAGAYQAVLCDVWGVVHNGVAQFVEAGEALARFRRGGGRVVLVTNAPRPHGPVLEQLRRLGVDPEAYDAVVTSGDVTRAILADHAALRVLHVGPDRDLSLYDGLGLHFAADDATAEIVSCTGLFDDDRETADDYVGRMEGWAARGLTMVCANPDLVVERGGQLIPCAGALAERYQSIGGTVVIAGKPYAPVYEAALAKLAALAGGPLANDRILAIGDGLPTDLRGAYDFGLDVLFVTAGIHAAAFGPADAPDAALVHETLAERGLGAVGFMPRLAW